MKRGKIIVIEGTDGSGKTIQFKKLVSRLKKSGISIRTFDFPRYGKPSCYFVTRYLRGAYGSLKEIGAQKASVFYAVDRFDVSNFIKKSRSEGKTIVLNRFVASNLGHQGSKITNLRERKRFFKWLDGFEHGILGIPRPDLNIVLHVPAEIAQRMVDKKGKRTYIGGARRDLHEANLAHLKRAERTYLEIVKFFPKQFKLIECFKSGKLLSIKAVHNLIWDIVKPIVR